ncbi:MAG: DUF2490 domain-containing protein [Halieaceae bacterium]|nr:DUF2490 domain-containing protein [Halieaceae bacterium]
MRSVFFLLFFFVSAVVTPAASQAQVDDSQLGAWYMYFWNTENKDTGFGWQGDIQHRNWDLLGDLEQLLIRGGRTWRPEGSNFKYTLGYANITSGAFGDSDSTSSENRIYQEALGSQVLADRWFLTHRFRLEQRWVDGQDFRNRVRYFLAANYPLNQPTLAEGAWYLSFYNELFVNLEQDIGDGRSVDYFDRNRTYAAVGHSLSNRLRLQFGYMWQENANFGKGQLQFNLFHSF